MMIYTSLSRCKWKLVEKLSYVQQEMDELNNQKIAKGMPVSLDVCQQDVRTKIFKQKLFLFYILNTTLARHFTRWKMQKEKKRRTLVIC